MKWKGSDSMRELYNPHKTECPVLTMQKSFCPSRNCLDTNLDEVFSVQKKKAQMLKI
jgi:hypothetical protein